MERDHIFRLYIQHKTGNNSAEEEQFIAHALREDPAFAAVWKELTRGEAPAPEEDAAITAWYKRRKKLVRQRFRTMVGAAVIMLLMAVGGGWYLQHKNRLAAGSLADLLTKPGPAAELVVNGRAQPLPASFRIGGAVIKTDSGRLIISGSDTAVAMLKVPAGQRFRVLLGDGTEAWLNAASSLQFPLRFTDGKREVTARGEVYFTIAAGAAPPFIIHAGANTVKGEGRVNVNTYTNGVVHTMVTAGNVQVTARNGRRQAVEAGMGATFRDGKFVLQPLDSARDLAWLNGETYYQQLPLQELASSASRFYGYTFVVANPKLLQRTFSGQMDRADLEAFLTDLKLTGNIRYTIRGKEIELR
ncbi:FecR domain-containing protein [Chitinophaga sp. CB10]|uniref:FecR family protein n=1 Tax=Chitinophaga sp. CB10 TaxID=1891659 RepID=UPI0025B7F01A|nr:FecR domain-containing protein [Chitinophaga sp. CB10]